MAFEIQGPTVIKWELAAIVLCWAIKAGFAFSCHVIPNLLCVHMHAYRNGDFTVGGSTERHVTWCFLNWSTCCLNLYSNLLTILHSTSCSWLHALSRVAQTEVISSALVLYLHLRWPHLLGDPKGFQSQSFFKTVTQSGFLLQYHKSYILKS